MNNQARAFSETLQKFEKKYGTDVNSMSPPLEDAVKVGEKRKCEEETDDNRGENTTDDQVNDSKRLKTDHEKAVKKVILDSFHVPEKEQEYYEDKNTNQVFVEIVMKQVTQPKFKDYLKLIMDFTPDVYRPQQSQLLYLINTAMESHRRASDKGELSELFNKSYVPGCLDMALAQHVSTKIHRQIDALLERSLGGETGDNTESQPNTVCPIKDKLFKEIWLMSGGSEDGMDTDVQLYP